MMEKKYFFFLFAFLIIVSSAVKVPGWGFCLSGGCSHLCPEKNEDNKPGLAFATDKNMELIKVHREGDREDWQGDTLGIVTWWDAGGEIHAQAISPLFGWKIKQIKRKQESEFLCQHKELGFSLIFNFTVVDDILTVNVPLSGISEKGTSRLGSLRLLPRFCSAGEGGEGYLVIPRDVGMMCEFKGKSPAEHFIPVYGSHTYCNMPFFGIIREEGGMAAIITSGQFDSKICVTTNWGSKHQYAIDPSFVLRTFAKEERLAEDITVQYHFLAPEESDWSGAAKRYRKYNFEQRGIKPLKERAEKSPELVYSARALEVRMRMGVKPVPTEVLEQTPETEPPVRIFLTFPRVRDIFQEFHRQGIGHAEFCIVGWNKSGHDGRFPQLFPVEKVFGGENELRKTIEFGQSLGYQVVAHDAYTGGFSISEDWNEEFVRKKFDGQLVKGAKYAGGQTYKLCLTRTFELFARRDLPRIRELGFKGLHYSDVLSITGPARCYDPRHPATLRQDAEATNRILALAKELFGGVQSEGALDFTASVLDRALYITILPKNFKLAQVPYADALIPLYPTVYHGTLLYNIWNDCVNSTPGDTAYLKNIEYGGMPVVYFYGHFWLDPGKDWLGSRDLHYASREGLINDVARLKPVYDDLQKLHHLQTEFIEGHHRLAEGVYITEYGNGQSVIVNYNNDPYVLSSGKSIPAKGFAITAHKEAF